MNRLSHAFASLTPEQVEGLTTTTDKHILGKRLTIGTAILCAVVFIWEVLDGGSRSERVAMQVLEAWLLFLAAYLGINVAQYGIKRGTDKDTKVEVAKAKAQGQPPTVVAQDDSTVQVTTRERPAAKPVTGERPAMRERPTGDARVDDESGS